MRPGTGPIMASGTTLSTASPSVAQRRPGVAQAQPRDRQMRALLLRTLLLHGRLLHGLLDRHARFGYAGVLIIDGIRYARR